MAAVEPVRRPVPGGLMAARAEPRADVAYEYGAAGAGLQRHSRPAWPRIGWGCRGADPSVRWDDLGTAVMAESIDRPPRARASPGPRSRGQLGRRSDGTPADAVGGVAAGSGRGPGGRLGDRRLALRDGRRHAAGRRGRGDPRRWRWTAPKAASRTSQPGSAGGAAGNQTRPGRAAPPPRQTRPAPVHQPDRSDEIRKATPSCTPLAGSRRARLLAGAAL